MHEFKFFSVRLNDSINSLGIPRTSKKWQTSSVLSNSISINTCSLSANGDLSTVNYLLNNERCGCEEVRPHLNDQHGVL